MTRVRYIADTLAEAISAARRAHGMEVPVLQAGPRRGVGLRARPAFEVVVDASGSSVRARRAAREALARAVVAARLAHAEAEAVVRSQLGPATSAAVARLGARLRAQALAPELVQWVIARVEDRLDGARAEEAAALMHAAAVQAVGELLPVDVPVDPAPVGSLGRPWVVALAGPTGVGKTTTLAKLAASWRVDRRLRVGIVAADAFRVGAVEQLRTYGSIIDAPVQAAHGPASAAEALARLADCDVVLVDTPGRGHRDALRIGEVAETVRAVRADESLLVLPGSASAGMLSESADAFRAVAPTRVVLSKLDESEGLGALVSAVRRSDRPAAWFTTGQGVPDDLERADARTFAERLVGPPPSVTPMTATDASMEAGRRG
ncbi:MAG: hypothetical protein FGM39_08845 [Phycisphaerales bacterium]|nr:hypothetical protein [Phycisphaerales bacterium]